MLVDLGNVEEKVDYVTVPEGRYVCRVADVREGRTRDGAAVRWAMRLEVAEGDYVGRTATWDGLVFSERGLPRVKRVLRLLGFDVDGSLELHSTDLLERRVLVDLVRDERQDETGRTIARLEVPFDGYAVAPPAAPRPPADEPTVSTVGEGDAEETPF